MQKQGFTISSSKLEIRNGQLFLDDLYEVAKSTVSITVREFCEAVSEYLQKVLVQMPNKLQFIEFVALHEIPSVMGAIDGSHIVVLALVVGAADYYSQKFFHLAIFQALLM